MLRIADEWRTASCPHLVTKYLTEVTSAGRDRLWSMVQAVKGQHGGEGRMRTLTQSSSRSRDLNLR